MMWPMAGAMTLSEHLRRPEPRRDAAPTGRREPGHRLQRLLPAHLRALGILRVPARRGGSRDRRSRASAPASRSGSHRTARASSRTFRSSPRSGCRSRSSACTPTCPPARRDGSSSSAARGCSRRCRTTTSCCSFRCSSSPGWRGSSTGAGRRAAGWRLSPPGSSRRCRLLPVLLEVPRGPRDAGARRDRWRRSATSAPMPASFLHAAPLMKFWREGPAHTYEQYLFTGRDGRAARARRPGRCCSSRKTRGPLAARSRADPLLRRGNPPHVGAGARARRPRTGCPRRRTVPYTWLLWLPGFNGLRVSSRFAMLGTLCLAMTASLAVAHLSKLDGLRQLRRWQVGRWRVLAGLVVIAGLLVDGMTRPVPVATPPGKVILPGSQQAAVIELPVDSTDVSVQAMYRSIFHRQPLVNGYSGHFPPHYKILSLSLARLRSDGALLPRAAAAARDRRNDRVRSEPQLQGHGREVCRASSRHGASGAGSVFLLPAQPAPREPPIGPALPATVRDAGRYLLEFDLGEARLLSALAFPLRRRYEELARAPAHRDVRGWPDVDASPGSDRPGGWPSRPR